MFYHKCLFLRIYEVCFKMIHSFSKSMACSILCAKAVRILSYSGPYIPAFGLNTDQNNFEYGHFFRILYSFIYFSLRILKISVNSKFIISRANQKSLEKWIYTKPNTTWKVSVFRDFLVRIFPYIQSVYSVRMREKTDQKNSEHEHFLRSVICRF